MPPRPSRGRPRDDPLLQKKPSSGICLPLQPQWWRRPGRRRWWGEDGAPLVHLFAQRGRGLGSELTMAVVQHGGAMLGEVGQMQFPCSGRPFAWSSAVALPLVVLAGVKDRVALDLPA
jgi:hypothetical protein